MMKRYILAALIITSLSEIRQAKAQAVVIDPAAIVQLVVQGATIADQLRTMENSYNVSQLNLSQLQSFYQSFSHITDASQVIPTLLQSSQQYPLNDLATLEGILRTNGSGFNGNLASSALSVLQQTQYFKSSQSDFAANEMNTRAANSAGQIAASQILYQSAQNRISGLDQLRTQLGSSSDPKQTMDLAARAQVENAVTQAQAQQTGALQMMQKAQQDQTEQRAEQNWREGAEAFENAENSAAGQ